MILVERRKMIATTPRGFKDVLPEEARVREQLNKKITAAIDLWGYDPIETPTLEVLDVLERGSKLDSTAFRLFDGDNKLLVMRPDVTLPIARMVASRLGNEDKELRFRYNLRVFRDSESAKSHSREFTQIGIERIGAKGPAADAETIIVFVESLLASGLEDFKIEICNVEVLKKLLEACDASDEFNDAVLTAYHESNYVKLDEVLDAASLDADISACIRELIRIHGGREAISRCRELLSGYVREQVFDELDKTYEIIEECGYAEYVGIDFSLLSSFDYYTGLIMEAYAPGFAKSIGGGGRYDNLLEVFGKKAPAAGFAFSLERLMHALSVQDNLALEPKAEEFIDQDDPEAFKKAMEAHKKGITTTIGGAR